MVLRPSCLVVTVQRHASHSRPAPAKPRSQLSPCGRLVLLVLAAACLAVLLTPGAQAVGSGMEVITDATGDSGGGTLATDLVRVGAGSFNNNLYIWMKPNVPYTTTAPTTAQLGGSWRYMVSTSYGPSQWCTQITALTDTNAVVSGPIAFNVACGEFVAGYNKPVTDARWVCNELQFKLPYTSLMTNIPGNPTPADGTDLLFQFVPDGNDGATSFQRVNPGAGGGWVDGMFGGLTYKLGNPYPLYPNAPSGVTASASNDNAITVTWTPGAVNSAQPVTGYRIYRLTNSAPTGYVLAGTSTTASFVDNDPPLSGTYGTTYAYKVAAVNCPMLDPSAATPPAGEPAYTGGESPRSAASTTLTPDFRPKSPGNLAAGSPTGTTLTLTWTASFADCPGVTPTCAGGSGATGVQGYKVYRGAAGAEAFLVDVPTPPACSGSSCTYQDTGLTPATEYCYYLRAYDGGTSVSGPNLSPAPTPIAPPAEACRSTTGGSTPPPPPPPPPPPVVPPPPPPIVTGCVATIQAADSATAEDHVSFVDKSVTPPGIKVYAWEWEFGDGSTSNQPNPTHVYVSPGNFTVRLSIWDNAGCTSMDLKHILVGGKTASPPTGSNPSGTGLLVDAGDDISAPEGTRVDLVASVASGPNGPDRDSLTFTWRQIAGPGVATTGAAAPVLTFTAPTVPNPERPVLLTFAVRATDGYATSPEDTVDVVVTTTNNRPVARAGSDQTAHPGATVTVDGSASSDPEGVSLSGVWEVLLPTDDAALASGAVTDLVQDGLRATFTAPRGGVGYIDLRLNVTDETYHSADTVRIWIQEPAAPPAAFVAQAQPDGVVTFLATGDAAQFTWVFGDGNETVTDSHVASHRYAESGPYTVSLSLDGAEVGSMTIHVAGSGASRPAEPTGTDVGGLSWLPVLLIAAVASVLVAGLLVWALRHRKA